MKKTDYRSKDSKARDSKAKDYKGQDEKKRDYKAKDYKTKDYKEKESKKNKAELNDMAAEETNLLIRGRHEVVEALKGDTKIESIVVSTAMRGGLLAELKELSRGRNLAIKELSSEIFAKKYGEKSQGVVAICGLYEYSTLEEIISEASQKNEVIIALNQVEDARNLGAIVRTAEVAGCGGIIIPKHRSAGMTEWAMRTAQGAASHLKVARVGNLTDAIEALKKNGYWVVGLEGEAEKLYTDFVYTGKVVLVAGGENVGLGERLRKACDELVFLPMFGKTSSLNVSVSVGIAVYEVLRQKSAAAKIK